MENDQFSPKARLYSYIDLVAKGAMDASTFCRSFEEVYNLELDKNSLTPIERDVFARLFDRTVWYSPFPEERKRIANYIGEAEVADAVNTAIRELGRRADGDP